MTRPSPLAGKRVANTRALHQADDLDALLRSCGALPLSFPCIAIVPPEDPGPLDAAMSDVVDGVFDWVVFTSVNTVEAVAARLGAAAERPGTATEGLAAAGSFAPSGRAAREPARGSPTAIGDPCRPASCLPGHPTSPCHPERSEGSPPPPLASSIRTGAPLDHPDAPAEPAWHDEPADHLSAAAREPVKGSPTGTGGGGAGGDGPGGQSEASPKWSDDPSASERLRDASPWIHPRATPSGRFAPATARAADPACAGRRPANSPAVAQSAAAAAASTIHQTTIPSSHLDAISPPARHPQRREGSPSSAPPLVAAVGRVTAEAVDRLLGWPVAYLPELETAAELGRTLPVAPGGRVLLPQSALAGPSLAAILRGRGAAVTDVVAYATGTGAGGVDLASMLAAGEVDAVCLTSGSTVRGLLRRLGEAVDRLAGVRVACMGTETAAVARELGLRIDVVPAAPSAAAMVAALAASFADAASGDAPPETGVAAGTSDQTHGATRRR